MDWRPSASLAALRQRAVILARLRAFFAARGVWEVETPILGASCASDPHLQAVRLADSPRTPRYWQTSPEAHMKRLLAAGSGAIYQIYRAAREGERGRLHNPEFTLLEWYRPGFDPPALIAEVDELVRTALADGPPLASSTILSYREAFRRHAGLDPFTAGVPEFKDRLATVGVSLAAGIDGLGRDGWLDLVMTHCVAPHLGRGGPCFVTEYPASQAAMARLLPGEPPRAARFELYLNGVELANGYHELTDAAEQRARIVQDLAWREAHGLPAVPVDEALLGALAVGLPDCAGVALGVDRLVMLAMGADTLDAVLAFPVERA
ncbi:MAG TPA: EF-P lysine aminoacylase EpmA [Candidatus Macondimonas sp.]|nr:EF-P lysine aminoacylase EpmA [Candidatus Macondimonas sp.]